MLIYLVEELLGGRAVKLKGYSIGIAVFGRGEDFDAQADPVVRLEAHRLRRDLASYYVSEGDRNPLRISIPKGNYIPHIERAEIPARPGVANGGPAPTLAEPSSRRTRDRDGDLLGSSRARPPRMLIGGALAALAILAGLLYATFGLTVRQGGDLGAARGRSVTVAQFDVLDGTPEASLLAIGIATQIVSDVSRFPDFRVYLPPAGPSATNEPRRSAGAPRTSYLVAGSVGVEGAEVRVSTRLVEAESGRVLWTEEFQRARTQDAMLGFQREVAASITSALGRAAGVVPAR